jgi:SAM-dependent methyltransferase
VTQGPRFYDSYAEWWPLFSPPDDYREEAEDLVRRLDAAGVAAGSAVLELGSGGGHLASHLTHRYRMTLTDRAEGMLAVSRSLNPGVDHICSDMRSLSLGRTFGAVLLHDAVMYMTTPDDLRAALRTAAAHCRTRGTLVVLPDCVRETFEPSTDLGGEDAEDGRGLRYLEWSWDPDPADDTFVTDYAFLLRSADGSVEVVHDRHVEGLFAREQWLRWLAEAGFDATTATDPWERDVFVARRR